MAKNGCGDHAGPCADHHDPTSTRAEEPMTPKRHPVKKSSLKDTASRRRSRSATIDPGHIQVDSDDESRTLEPGGLQQPLSPDAVADLLMQVPSKAAEPEPPALQVAPLMAMPVGKAIAAFPRRGRGRSTARDESSPEMISAERTSTATDRMPSGPPKVPRTQLATDQSTMRANRLSSFQPPPPDTTMGTTLLALGAPEVQFGSVEDHTVQPVFRSASTTTLAENVAIEVEVIL